MIRDEQTSLCFIIPYFGQWPFWMPFFLESCRANASINWLLFSDCGQVEHCPPNVQIIDISFNEYCDRVSERLGIDFHPTEAYKLCDLKPALGYIHEQELAHYDFWAFGDIDLIYGDLRAYFTAKRLAKKDLFATHVRRISGHCCILRNSAEMRERFFAIDNWQLRLSDTRHLVVDESAFSQLFIRYKNWPDVIGRFLSTVTNPWFRQAEFIEAYSTPNGKRPWHDGSHDFPQHWFWQDGQLTNDRDGGREFPYLHFMNWKKWEWRGLAETEPADYLAIATSRSWQISADGFSCYTKEK